jgi:NAD(P)-dependent dehydrogenase (short-subunit alcohol dehydrogenase family)
MKTGIVTGSSRGIGLATVQLLTQHRDTQIVGTSTSGNHILSGPNFICHPLDLSDSVSIDSFVEMLDHGKIDFLINNAGVLLDEPNSPKMDINVLKRTFDTNFFGTVELTEKLLPMMQKNAHIINITSDWGSFSEANFDAYHAAYKMSKTALNMYTKLLSERLKGIGITVSALDPGWTQTDMGGAGAARKPKEVALEIWHLLEHGVDSGQFWHRNKVREW